MLLSTTHNIDGKAAKEYLGIVVGEAILGTSVIRDITAGIRDIIGGRSGRYEEKLREARQIALKEMEEEASKLGANAVLGIDIDYETVGQGMLMVTATGTAVKLA